MQVTKSVKRAKKYLWLICSVQIHFELLAINRLKECCQAFANKFRNEVVAVENMRLLICSLRIYIIV